MHNGYEGEPAFVLCAARSGSTLLRWVLDTHPDVFAPPELHLGKLCADLLWTYTYSTALADPARITADANARTSADVRRLMADATVAHGKKLWCEKSVASLEYFDLLRGVFPRARFICLYRHGADAIHSALEAQGRRPGGFGFEPYIERARGSELDGLADYWCEQTLRLLAAQAAAGERALAVRYESLVGAGEETVRRVFEFLRVSPAPGLLERVFTTAHAAGPGDGKILATDRIVDRRGAGRAIEWSRLDAPRRRRLDAVLARAGYPALDAYFEADAPLS